MSQLTMENVTYRYRNSNQPAVKQASYAFKLGSVYAIIGLSGSGKSTLLSMLAGLDLPSEGDIRYGGENPSGRRNELHPKSLTCDKTNMLVMVE